MLLIIVTSHKQYSFTVTYNILWEPELVCWPYSTVHADDAQLKAYKI